MTPPIRPALAPLLLAAAALPLATSCAGTGSRAAEAPTTERLGYEAVSHFVPPGTESVILVDVERSLDLLGKIPAPLHPGGPLHFAYAGRDFGIPLQQGFGPAQHVLAYDPGPRGVDPGNLPREGQDGVAELEQDGDRLLWRRTLDDDATNPFAQPWVAALDRRWLVEGTSRELVEAALAAREAGTRYLPLALPKGFDWGMPILLIRRLDSQADPAATPAPGEARPRAVLAGFCLVARPCEDGLEGRLWIHGTDPDQSRFYFGQRYGISFESGYIEEQPGWWSVAARVRLGPPVPRGRRLLYLLSLAGLKILVEPTAG
ncbi:MAG: hypothetical protein R3F30_07435 [Planctomycetota bacterium]